MARLWTSDSGLADRYRVCASVRRWLVTHRQVPTFSASGSGINGLALVRFQVFKLGPFSGISFQNRGKRGSTESSPMRLDRTFRQTSRLAVDLMEI